MMRARLVDCCLQMSIRHLVPVFLRVIRPPNTVTTVPSSSQHDDAGDPSVTLSTAKTDYDVRTYVKIFTSVPANAKRLTAIKPCSLLFPLEHFVDMCSQASVMTHQELDLVLMGSLMTTLHDHDTTVARGRHKPVRRAKITSHFMHNRYHMCMHTFAFLFGIGTNHCIKAIKKHYLENEMEPQVYKNIKRLSPKTASYEEILALVKFYKIMLKLMPYYYLAEFQDLSGMT